MTTIPTGTRMSEGMRRILLGCGALNLVGAICFAPPVTAVRRVFHFPDAPPLYLWILASWILAFGVAYAYQGWTRRPNRSVLALGAWGKAAFALAVVSPILGGGFSALTGAAAAPDAIGAAIFCWWLWRDTSVRSAGRD